MKTITISIGLTDELGIKVVTIDQNDTHLPENSTLIKMVCVGILKSLKASEDSVAVQDLLSELKIKR
jgi:hypothetical protein